VRVCALKSYISALGLSVVCVHIFCLSLYTQVPHRCSVCVCVCVRIRTLTPTYTTTRFKNREHTDNTPISPSVKNNLPHQATSALCSLDPLGVVFSSRSVGPSRQISWHHECRDFMSRPPDCHKCSHLLYVLVLQPKTWHPQMDAPLITWNRTRDFCYDSCSCCHLSWMPNWYCR